MDRCTTNTIVNTGDNSSSAIVIFDTNVINVQNSSNNGTVAISGANVQKIYIDVNEITNRGALSVYNGGIIDYVHCNYTNNATSNGEFSAIFIEESAVKKITGVFNLTAPNSTQDNCGIHVYSSTPDNNLIISDCIFNINATRSFSVKLEGSDYNCIVANNIQNAAVYSSTTDCNIDIRNNLIIA